MIKSLKNKSPKIHEEAFIAETADVLGDVTIGEGTSIWYGAVARGDMNTIVIGKYSNVQDNSSLHVDSNEPLKIGDYTTVGHNAVVHGCTIGNNCLIGMGAIILNNAIIGDNCIIGAGALITEGAVIPPNSLVLGAPGKVKRELTEDDIKSIKDNAVRYEKLWKEQHI
ncbi:gamma carbonic anhydrase family protein [Tissierella sp. MB52-C2]|uniref:gamma carbonic anhydrase family protein n=1 Tax=Tissierella sp. MB52-C2 TaxID=3070999 RepID=UPI00280C3CE0|nr:gamma carbonic anhydrase family protein [Tissierella sp. MB52-C2]WMM23695.1 gamma carbonic anhydrase family protein [Tissierella sp. MB52-C2]